MALPEILNLDGESIVRISDGTPVQIDAGSDVGIAFGDRPLTELRVNFASGRAVTDSIGIQLGAASGITAPDGLSAGAAILVDGVQIGTIGDVEDYVLSFDFFPGVTKAQVEQLIRALTYSDTSNTGDFRAAPVIRVLVSDGQNYTLADVTVADSVVGTDDADTFTVTILDLDKGDRLAGGSGGDTLTLTGGGTFALNLMGALSGIETITGTAATDEIVITGHQLGDVQRIDGGGAANDTLTVTGTADLTGKAVVGFRAIKIGSHGGSLTVDDATARLITGYGTAEDRLTLTEGVLTAQERLALHRRGVDTIVAREVEGGDYVTTTHHAPTVANFNGNYVNAAVGTPVFIDANRDAHLTVDDGRLKSMSVHVTGDVLDGEVIGIAGSTRLTLSNTDNPTIKNLHYDGVAIGLVAGLGSANLSIGFDANSTAAMAQEVLRSLTYTN